MAWSDLRSSSGTTRCGDTTPATPLVTHLSWDSFVASAAGGLPGSPNPSASVATRLLTDGEGGGQANSDDWFPWLAVDQTTGQAWTDFYSTRDDSLRRTTNFYVRSVTPSLGGHALGTLTRVSSQPSNYSTNPCCNFGNDYGDYTGLDATSGVAIPVWSDKRTAGDGEAFTFVEGPFDGDGDGIPDGSDNCPVAPGPAANQGCPLPPPDTTAPETTINSAKISQAKRKVTLRFSSSESGSTFECKLDKKPFKGCRSPTTYKKLKPGKHKLQVVARDVAGNLDRTPAVQKLKIKR